MSAGEARIELAEDAPRTNWSGNYSYSTNVLLQPATIAEVQDAVRSSTSVRALGTRHSFNDIADSDQAQISVLKLKDVTLDRQAATVTVGAGIRYGELALLLDEQGFALHNMASLPHISVSGAVATATHGSGVGNGNLATPVTAIEFVAGDGSVQTITRAGDPDRFPGAVVSLGALGIVTHLRLKVQPRFEMTQVVYEDLPFSALEQHLLEIMGAGYSVSLFTDWQNSRAGSVWIKRRLQGFSAVPPLEFFGAALATRKLHPIQGHPADACTDQLNVPGPWYERLPHFKLEFTPSSGRELQSEYFVPLERGYEAIRAVESLRDAITPILLTSELRAVAADDLWMSMAYQRASLALHFTWKLEAEAVLEVLPRIEAKLAPFGARPHWGKVFTMRRIQGEGLYSRMDDFRTLALHFDREMKFQNKFLRARVGLSTS